MRRQIQDSLQSKNIVKLTEDYYVDSRQEIGRGKFGVVYKGYNSKKNQIIAVKYVSKKMLNQLPKYERELIVLEDIAKFVHPYIMGYYGYHLDNHDGLYIFMEFCQGGNLTQFIKQKISQLKVLTLFEQIISGMIYMNDKSKIHRDLKPDNIMMSERKDIKIADFGLAREMSNMMTKEVGTPLYRAPEVLKGGYNQKCDVWSVGLILYYMLTQGELFKHVNKTNQLMEEYKKFENNTFDLQLPSQLHPQWIKILKRMLLYNPTLRPTFPQLQAQFRATMDKMRKDLIQRYGYENIKQEEAEVLRLTRSHINPYEEAPPDNQQPNNKFIDMLEKLKEENSYAAISNVRRWLNFTSAKHQTVLSIINEFNGCPYNLMLNIYKYIIMFLLISGLIAKHLELIKMIDGEKFLMPDGNFKEQTIVAGHKKYFSQMLLDLKTKFNSSININKKTLKNQIIQPVFTKYILRKNEQAILSSIPGLIECMKNAQKDIFDPYEKYASMYNQVIGSQNVYFSTEVIKGSDKFELANVRVYAYIRIASRLDKLLDDNQYKNEDYMKMKKQSFHNSNKEQLLTIISSINNQ